MRAILLWCLMIAGTAAAGAELESKVDRPYDLVVCLNFSDDPSFTQRFVDSLRRQVRDQLANYFGKLAEVKVVSAFSPPGKRDAAGRQALLGQAEAESLAGLLERIESTGLGQLTLSPAEFAEENLPDKVFLVALDFDGGIHRIRWRQLDGDVQQIGPLYRRTTPDRHWLAKAVCLAVKEDFAPVALVEPDPYEKGKVRLQFRGQDRDRRGHAGNSLLKRAWLADGCLLQPFWVIRQSDGSLARRPIPHTVLQIDDGNSPKRATLMSGLEDPLRRTPRVAGFQAIKLTTRTGRFRLRLVDDETGGPVLGDRALVYADDKSFDDIDDTDLLLNHDRNGYVVADRPLQGIAYIKISLAAAGDVKMALPITDDWVERVCRLRIHDAPDLPEWQRDLSHVVQDLQVLQAMMDEDIRVVNDLNRKNLLKPALQRIESAIKLLRKSVRTAGLDVDDLQRRAKPLNMSQNSLLVWAARQIEEIQQREKELADLATRLEQRINTLDARGRADVLIQLATQAENAGSIDDAIDKYTLALKEYSQLPRVRQYLDKLKQARQIKSPQHEEARTFIDQQWARVKVKTLRRDLPKAQKAFDVISQVGVDDQFAARRLMKINGRHISQLTELVDWLADAPGDQNRADLETYGKLHEQLVDFQLRVSEYVEARAKGRQPEPPPARHDEPPPEPRQPPAKTQQPPAKTEQPLAETEEPLQLDDGPGPLPPEAEDNQEP